MPNQYFNEWPKYAPHDLARRDNTLVAAKLMMNAALTAPITGGIPEFEGNIVTGYEELEEIAAKMEELSHGRKWEHEFKYEAVMVRESDVVIFLADYRAGSTPLDLECGGCGGRPDCSFFYEGKNSKYGLVDTTARKSGRPVDGPLCVARVHNLGYAVGSAMFMAGRLLVDARPFMSVGLAGKELGYCPKSDIVVGIPVSTLSKNPYLDIHPDYHLINLEKAIDHFRKTWMQPRNIGVDYRKFNPAKVKEREVKK